MTDEFATRVTEMSKEARFLLDRTVCGDVPVCPLCGASSVSVRTSDKGGFAVMCNGCSTTTEHEYDTIEEAWCAWVGRCESERCCCKVVPLGEGTEESRRELEEIKQAYRDVCASVSGLTPEEIEAVNRKTAEITKRDSGVGE